MIAPVMDGMTPTQAACELGLSRERVRQLCDLGRLRYVRTPFGRLIDRASVTALVRQRAGWTEPPPAA